MVSLQFITHQTDRYTYFESALMALEGGCKWIQLRMKEAPCEEVEAVALQLKPLCKEKEAILLLDDHVELAKAFIIGGTANTFEDVVQHYRAGADYLGIGPFRFTTTKKNLSPVLGLEGYAAILSQMKEANIELPVVAIGGITCEDIPAILETGVNGIALSGTILRAEDPAAETRKILNMKCIIK